MKTLFLLSGLQVGGTETKSVKIVNELNERGRSVDLAYLQGPEHLLPEIGTGVTTTCLQRRGKLSWRALQNLRRLVAERNIELIVCMNEYPLLYAATLKLFMGFDHCKVILAINTTEFMRVRDRLFMLIYSRLIRHIDGVVYGCEFQRRLWQTLYRLKSVESRVIYNGVNAEFFNRARTSDDLRERLGLADSFVVGCVGRLEREKNQSALLSVAARLNSETQRCDVLLIGDGPERESLKQQAIDLEIGDRVHFLGRMDDVRCALTTMDVFALPSIAVETFSNAALEAMAMSLPVALSDIAGAQEMVVDGETGFLYEKDDLERLTNLLVRLRDDAVLRETIGQNARDAVARQFDINQMYDAYEALLGNG
jgi:glycosyltransferase involved in cell wall biosynthesis